MTRESRHGSPEEELFRDALHRTADTLSPLPDLVLDAVREGQRRRARRRGLAVAGAFVAVTAVTLGLALLGPLVRQTPDAEPAAPPPGPSLTRPTPEPSPTPVPSLTRPAPGPSPDPTEPVTGMPIPASPPTPHRSTPPAAPPAAPGPARSAAGPFAPSPHPGATR
ncbi:hypothetical protein AB0387_09525 [Streptomyces sp. NPDC089173]|uniref:hypothetical protein n=1 Tax=Streptomyces sp. NPDC089173 TaxID=3154965 RepID=UPI00344FCA42